MLAADGCASSSGNRACCFCGVWAPAGRGSGGRHVRALTGLGMLICRNEDVVRVHGYTLLCIFTAVWPPDEFRADESMMLADANGRRSDRHCGDDGAAAALAHTHRSFIYCIS